MNTSKGTKKEQDSVLKFRAIYEMAQDGMLITNDQGRYIDANPAACALLGMKRHHIIGRYITHFADPHRKEEVQQSWRHFLESGSQKGFFRIFRPDGTTRHVEYIAQANIAPHQHLSILRDITERDRSEKTLRNSEDSLRLALESTDLGMWDFNPRTRQLKTSDRCKTLLGITSKRPITYGSLFKHVHPEDRPRVRRAIRQSMLPSGNNAFETDFRCLYRDKTIRWMIAKGRCFFDGKGGQKRASRFIGIVLDVTERKQTEHDLLTAKKSAEEAADAKTRFLANISHELRTPLNGILGTIELLRLMPLTSEQREYVTTMEDSGETLTTLINEILDFSKIEAGKLKLDLKNFNLENTLQTTQALFAERIRFKKLKVMTRLHADVPSVLRGDAVRLRQILTNLIGNAVKFTMRGQVIVEIAKEKEDASRIVLKFSIRDTGPGISQEKQRLLFLPFSQVDSSAMRQHGGTGLGLAISKQLVELMSGQIGVKSSFGKGSTFWFSIPFIKQKRAASIPTTTPTQTSPTTFAPKSANILVAEDNRINRLVAIRQLEKLGYKVDTAENGRQAVEALRRKQYDLIFMDCQMPGMDGYQATQAIRRQEKDSHIPIIAMTAHALEEDRRKCLNAGMDGYLTKPVQLIQLRAILKQQLGVSTLVDPRQWKQTVAFSGNTIEQLMTFYMEDTTAQLKALRQAIQEKAAQKVRDIAHSALGASTMLGMTAVAESLQQLENMGASKKLAGAPSVVKQAEEDLQRTFDYLRSLPENTSL